MRKYCLTLDLKNKPDLIKEYIDWHNNVWPEIVDSIHLAGIISMEIFNYENRLVMIMETEDSFSFEKKSKMDAENEKVQEWENIMWKYQEQLPGSLPQEKWVVMNSIFKTVIDYSKKNKVLESK
jgi:L-rhamnose mutarotase